MMPRTIMQKAKEVVKILTHAELVAVMLLMKATFFKISSFKYELLFGSL